MLVAVVDAVVVLVFASLASLASFQIELPSSLHKLAHDQLWLSPLLVQPLSSLDFDSLCVLRTLLVVRWDLSLSEAVLLPQLLRRPNAWPEQLDYQDRFHLPLPPTPD